MSPHAQLDHRTRWLALLVLCLGDLMIVLDTTIVNVALPSIQADLGFSETSLAWVVNAYLLTFGGFLLLGGRLGDLFGHRRLFLVGIALFTAASLACGLANTQGVLVAARAVQGVGGAVVSAVALSLIMVLFTEPGERAKAMGVFGFVLRRRRQHRRAAGRRAHRRARLALDLPGQPPDRRARYLGLRCGWCRAATARRRGGGRLDVAGAVTVTASLMLAVYAIVNGNDAGWGSAQTLGLLAAAAVLLARLPGHRVAGRGAADAAAAVPAAQRADRERRRRALGRGDVRLVLPLGAVPAAGARLQPAAGRPRLPARPT